MSSFNEYEIGMDDLTQELHEQQIVNRFNYPRRQIRPHIGALILCLLGLGIVVIVIINSNEAQVGDLVIKLSHSKFYTKVQVWIRMHNGLGGWESATSL
jgi:hypothetical protein